MFDYLPHQQEPWLMQRSSSSIHGYYPGIPLTLGGPPVLESQLEAVDSTSVRKLDVKAHLKFKIWWFLRLRARMGLRGNISYICLSQFFSRVYLFLCWVSHLTKSTAFLGYNVSSKKVTDTILRNNCYCALSPVWLFAPHGLYPTRLHGIPQARILEQVAISFSRGSYWPRGQTCISCIGRQIFYHWASW